MPFFGFTVELCARVFVGRTWSLVITSHQVPGVQWRLQEVIVPNQVTVQLINPHKTPTCTFYTLAFVTEETNEVKRDVMS